MQAHFIIHPYTKPTTTTADAHFTKGNCESLGNFLYVKKEIRQRYLYIKKDKPKYNLWIKWNKSQH